MIRIGAILLFCALLAACASNGERPMVDVSPVGDGLHFVGMAGVLAALIIVFGRFVSESKLTSYAGYILGGLLILLALIVGLAAVPALIIPITAVIAILVIVAVVGQRWK